MYRPNNLQNITYVWNNAEGLMGDDITFLVCRALIKLPPDKQEVGKVAGISGRNIVEGISWASNPKEVKGRLLVDLSLQLPGTGRKNTELIKLALPYQALIKSMRVGEVNPEVKYLHAKRVGVDSLLIEGIISLTSLGYLPWRGGLDVTGEFSGSSTIKVEKSLPEVKEMVSAQIRFIPYYHDLKGSTLKLNGWKEIHLMYIAENNRGENVIVTRQLEPFTQEISLNTELKSLGNLEISNGNVQSHVIASREVIVKGEFTLTAQPAPFMMETPLHDNLILKVKEMTQKVQDYKNKRDKKVQEPIEKVKELTPIEEANSSIKENTTPINVVLEKPIIIEEEIITEQREIDKTEKVSVDAPSAINENENIISKEIQDNSSERNVVLRESRRNRLNKHMRKLESL